MGYIMRDVLEAYKLGEITLEEAERRINQRLLTVDEKAFFDIWRRGRTGTMEIIMGDGKGVETLIEIINAVVGKGETAIISRLDNTKINTLKKEFENRYHVMINEQGRIMAITNRPYSVGSECGRVAIVTGGTADIAVAEEAKFLLEILGVKVITRYDIGIAALHRVYKPLMEIMEFKASCIIAVAGMEGALPTIVAGLVSLPVIGVPTSNGYGYASKGQAALMTMLQSCTPMVVVNIDNGVSAALVAYRIAKQSIGP